MQSSRSRATMRSPMAVIVLVLAMILAACGDSEDSADTTAGGDDTGTTSATTSPSAELEYDAEGFGMSYEAVLEAAKDEPPVQWCTGMGDDEYGPIVAAFAAEYPDVPTPEAFECSGEEATQRVMTEWEAGVTTVDVLDADTEVLELMDAEDLTHVQDWSVFEGSPLEIDEQFFSFGGRIISVGSSQRIIAYNTELMSPDEVPQRYEDCADPKFKGQIAIDVRPPWFELMEAAGGPWSEDEMREWAEGVAANEPLWVRGSSQGFAVLASGERAVHCGLQLHGLFRGGRTDINDGADSIVWFIIPERSISRDYLRLSLAPEPAAPNGTILFGAWMASKTGGQLAIAEANAGYGNPNVEGTWVNEQYQEAGAEILSSTQQEIAAVSDRMNEIILEAWGFPEPVPRDD